MRPWQRLPDMLWPGPQNEDTPMRVVLGALATMLLSTPAIAATTVIGNGFGRQCYEAAEFGKSSRAGLAACTSALASDDLSIGDRAATLVNRGIVQMQAKNQSAAIADYDAAIRLRPRTAEAYINKAIALMHLGGHDAEAVALLSDGLARHPSRPEIAYYTRGIANELIGDTRAAYEDFAQAVAIAPNWADAQAELARYQIVRRKTAAG